MNQVFFLLGNATATKSPHTQRPTETKFISQSYYLTRVGDNSPSHVGDIRYDLLSCCAQGWMSSYNLQPFSGTCSLPSSSSCKADCKIKGAMTGTTTTALFVSLTVMQASAHHPPNNQDMISLGFTILVGDRGVSWVPSCLPH